MRTLIQNATIVNEGRSFQGDILIENDRIAAISADTIHTPAHVDLTIDASGCFVLPGVIDTHVHFREPGLTQKADIESESRAAAWGGVTSFFDMPNTQPQTTTLEALDEKHRLAREKSHVNYTFFFGATNDNTALFDQLDAHRVPGIKLFMGSSTGNMLVHRDDVLERIFTSARLPIMAHCEDTGIINQNMAAIKKLHGDDPDVCFHPLIRSEEACLRSTMKAIELAVLHNARLHVAHVTTALELEMFSPHTTRITAEATIGHLMFSLVDYKQLGTRIKVNPAIKNYRDLAALRQGLTDSHVYTVATDHAPHLLADKQGGCARAASGMPMIQFSLVSMLSLVDEGVLPLERVATLMSHHPAQLFEVRDRGFLRPGFKADLVIVRPNAPWTVTPDIIQSRCGWSPMEGRTFQWRVEQTFCNGRRIFNQGVFDDDSRGEPLLFR